MSNIIPFEPQHLAKPGTPPSGDFCRMASFNADTGELETSYVTSYLCLPDSLEKDFLITAAAIHALSGGQVSTKGPLAHSLVHAFADDPDLTHESAHQISIEFAHKAFREYPFIVATHVHPVTDETGHLHGTHIHSHIILCAYRAAQYYEGELLPAKYNSNHSSREGLKVLNDRIAIQHGLSITRNPDSHRYAPWGMTDAERKRMDELESVRRVLQPLRDSTASWAEFTSQLTALGYAIHEGAHITYTSPEGISARDDHMGRDFTKPAIECYWLHRDVLRGLLADLLDAVPPPYLYDLTLQHGLLSAQIPIGSPGPNRQHCPYPLKTPTCRQDVLESYFDPLERYDITDISNSVVTTAFGYHILQYLNTTRHGKIPYWATAPENLPTDLRSQVSTRWYPNNKFRVRRNHADGTARSTPELQLRLTAIEQVWDSPPADTNQLPVTLTAIIPAAAFALQQLWDSIRLLQEEDLESEEEILRAYKAAIAALDAIEQTCKNLASPPPEALEALRKTRKKVARFKTLLKQLAPHYPKINGLLSAIQGHILPGVNLSPLAKPVLDKIIQSAAARVSKAVSSGPEIFPHER